MPKVVPSILKAARRTRPRGEERLIKPLKDVPHVVSGLTQYAPPDPFKQKRPPTPVELVLAYRQFTYWCANTVSSAVATVPHRLYAIQGRGEKAGRFRTKAITRTQVENLASNPNIAKKLAAADRIEEVTQHPYLEMIHKVNPWMNQYALFELTQLYLETVGSAFWTFVRGFGGLPVEIWPLPAWLVYVMVDYAGTEVVDRYILTAGGGQRIFDREEVLYIKRTSIIDPYTQAWSPLRAAYEQTQLFDKLVEYDESRLSNFARPDAVLESDEPGPISWEETQRVNSWFLQNFSQAQVGGVWIAPGGMKLKPYTWPSFDPIAGERAKQTRYDIARVFDIPPAMVDSTGTSRANLDATLLEFARRAVLPRCRRLEEELNSNLLPIYDDRLFVSFDQAVPADQVLERETHKAYIGMGVMTINEVRLEKGLAPVKGGDELMVSNSLVPLSQALEPPAPVIPTSPAGTPIDEVPDEARTPQTSDRDAEEPEDQENDEEFSEGQDLEASTGEPDEATKAWRRDEAEISDAMLAKALRVIDWCDRQIGSEVAHRNGKPLISA